MGMTAYTLADAQTGYVYHQELYTGSDDRPDKTRRLVNRVCQPIAGKKHHVYMDNYFSSPAVFQDLENQGTGACGTMRCDRIGTPQSIKVKVKDMAVGDTVFERDGNKLFVTWKDKRKVTVISTVHNSMTFEKQVKQKHGAGFTEITKPCAIELYTQYMGGVDRADRLLWTYLNIHRSLKWWKKVFFYLLEVSFVNALIIYRSFRPDAIVRSDKVRLDLIDGLLANYQRPNPRPGRRSTDQPQRLTERHYPAVNPKKTPAGRRSEPDCFVCSKRGPGCKRHQTKHICAQCEKPMCTVPCFGRYHSLQDYKADCTKEYHGE
ncbi:piggyBac transposable element-derived protein 4-like [Antedon mediterranea]|uniref:piggyBac transposable element-derived protein 4-like n=1 Tax=Antedon mediterranea TaxID=105859 RepID=UPI003AF54161